MGAERQRQAGGRSRSVSSTRSSARRSVLSRRDRARRRPPRSRRARRPSPARPRTPGIAPMQRAHGRSPVSDRARTGGAPPPRSRPSPRRPHRCRFNVSIMAREAMASSSPLAPTCSHASGRRLFACRKPHTQDLPQQLARVRIEAEDGPVFLRIAGQVLGYPPVVVRDRKRRVYRLFDILGRSGAAPHERQPLRRPRPTRGKAQAPRRSRPARPPSSPPAHPLSGPIGPSETRSLPPCASWHRDMTPASRGGQRRRANRSGAALPVGAACSGSPTCRRP